MPYVVKKPQRETAATRHFTVLILVPAFYHTPPGAQLSAHLHFPLLFCCLSFPGYDVQMLRTPSFLRETPTSCPVSPRKAPVQLLPRLLSLPSLLWTSLPFHLVLPPFISGWNPTPFSPVCSCHLSARGLHSSSGEGRAAGVCRTTQRQGAVGE